MIAAIGLLFVITVRVYYAIIRCVLDYARERRERSAMGTRWEHWGRN
jgi:hypothetical protein